jgi:hypothetical protein
MISRHIMSQYDQVLMNIAQKIYGLVWVTPNYVWWKLFNWIRFMIKMNSDFFIHFSSFLKVRLFRTRIESMHWKDERRHHYFSMHAHIRSSKENRQMIGVNVIIDLIRWYKATSNMHFFRKSIVAFFKINQKTDIIIFSLKSSFRVWTSFAVDLSY